LTPFPHISEGVLHVYRLFDVADDIDVARAETRLIGAGARLRLFGERAGFLELRDRPLALALRSKALEVEGGVRRKRSTAAR